MAIRHSLAKILLLSGILFFTIWPPGELGYMIMEEVGQNRFATGGGGGGNSGGDWTPPAL